MSAPSLRLLPFAVALCAAACHTPPAVPVVAGFDAFTVGYRGEVVAHGAAMPTPDPVAVRATSNDARLVTVRTTLVEMAASTAAQFVPALLETDVPTSPPVAAVTAAPAAGNPDRLQPREPGAGPPRFDREPVPPAERDATALAPMRGVHVHPQEIQKAVDALLAAGLARRVGEPEVSCAEGMEASVSCLDQTALVSRVDLVPSGGSQFAFDFAVDTVQHGTWLQLAPRRTAAGGLELGIRLQLRELLQPVPIATTRFGRLHLPAIAVQDLRALTAVQPRDALVLGTMSGSRADMVVLAIVEISAGSTGKGTWILP